VTLTTATYRVEYINDNLYDVYDMNVGKTRILEFQELPDYIVERLSVLRMMRPPPSEHIDGVGQRVTENLYWIEV